MNEQGNVPRRGPIPKFSDLEIVALSLAAEVESIDSEKCFSSPKYKNTEIEFPILFLADSSMTAGRKRLNCMKKSVRDLPIRWMEKKTSLLWISSK